MPANGGPSADRQIWSTKPLRPQRPPNALAPRPEPPAAKGGEAGGGASASHSDRRKSNVARTCLPRKLKVSIAAQRCKLARSLLEWRLRRQQIWATWINQPAGQTKKIIGAAHWRGSRMSAKTSVRHHLFALTLASALAFTLSPA